MVNVGRSPKRLAVGAVSVGAVTESVRQNFDDVAKDKLPQGWKIEASNPKGQLTDWTVGRDANAPSNPNVLSLTKIKDTSGGVFNLCWNPTAIFKDGEIEVKVRANTGKVDQGGGLFWRARDANNYYIARYNPLESNFRLYYVKNGARKRLADASGVNIKAVQELARHKNVQVTLDVYAQVFPLDKRAAIEKLSYRNQFGTHRAPAKTATPELAVAQ